MMSQDRCPWIRCVLALVCVLVLGACSGREVATLDPATQISADNEPLNRLQVGDDVRIELKDGREFSGFVDSLDEAHIALRLSAPISAVRRREVKILMTAEIESITLLDRRVQDAAGLSLTVLLVTAVGIFALISWGLGDISMGG